MAKAWIVDKRNETARLFAESVIATVLRAPVEKLLSCSTENIAVIAMTVKRGEAVMPATEDSLIRFINKNPGQFTAEELDDLVARLDRASDSGVSAKAIYAIREGACAGTGEASSNG